MNEHDVVSVRIENRIAWVKFARPDKRNAMSPALNRRMMDVLDELEFDDNVGVLVLGGEGTAWSAGMDLKEYFRETEAQGLRGVRRSQRESYGWFRRLRWYQKPTIAMDTDGDGRISRAEAQANPALADEFDALDTRHSGYLTREQLAGWLIR